MSIPANTSHRHAFRAVAVATALALALPLSLTGAAPAYAGPASEAGRLIDNATITAQVKSKLIADRRTRAFDINVDTTGDGRVILRGTAPSAEARAAASAVAWSVAGVAAVENALLVAPPGSVAERSAPPATASQRVERVAVGMAESSAEALITAKVKAAFFADDQVKGFAIAVSTDDGVVQLAGSVPSESARSRAIELAADVDGVTRVDISKLLIES